MLPVYISLARSDVHAVSFNKPRALMVAEAERKCENDELNSES